MPNISAICVSHSSRFGLLQRAVLNFLEQKCHERELVIVVNQEGYYDAIKSFLRDNRLEDAVVNDANYWVDIDKAVHVHHIGFRDQSEGFLKGCVYASGTVVACWDDDNLSHPARLHEQAMLTSFDRPSVLGSAFTMFYDSDELFMGSFAQPSGKPGERCALGSLMAYRRSLPNPSHYNRGLWAEQVLTNPNYDILNMDPWLFMQGSNGNNYRGSELLRRLGSGLPGTMTAEALNKQSEILAEVLKWYRFANGKANLYGKDGGAFVVDELPAWPDWFSTTAPPEDWHDWLPDPDIQSRLTQERRNKRNV